MRCGRSWPLGHWQWQHFGDAGHAAIKNYEKTKVNEIKSSSSI
jgi:hypothetical protein